MLLSMFGHMLSFAGGVLEYPTLPANAVRFQFVSGVNPSSATYLGTWLQKSAVPNVWDCFPRSNSWEFRFNRMHDGTGIGGNFEILGMNMSGVTDATGAFYDNPYLVSVSGIIGLNSSPRLVQMFSRCTNLARVAAFHSDIYGMDLSQMFENCPSLVAVPSIGGEPSKTYRMFSGCASLVNMPKMSMIHVNDASYMFYGCTSLESIDSDIPGDYREYSAISDATAMFYNCVNVASGILDLYNVLSVPPAAYHLGTFYNCGINSATGSQELLEIPASWK